MTASSRRKGTGVCLFTMMGLMTMGGIAVLGVILVLLAAQGSSVLTWEFLSAPSQSFGQQGGIRYQILGTLALAFSAGLIGLPVALGTALYQTEYLSRRWKTGSMRLLYALNGVPTILFGLFGYLVFGLYLGLGISWLSGSLILAMMILPTLVVSIRDAIEAIPHQYREAGLALGLTTSQLIRSVIVPRSASGIVTGLLLGLARAIGETAAIMFTATAFSGIDLPRSWSDPVLTLQTHILVLSQEALDPSAKAAVWGTALVLVMMVFLLSVSAMVVRSRLHVRL